MSQNDIFNFEDNLFILMEALRKDAANGTLGRLRNADLVPADFVSVNDDANIAVIDLLLNSYAAGVPTAFEPNHLWYKDDLVTAGLVQSITINSDHVNTVRLLVELGVLTR